MKVHHAVHIMKGSFLHQNLIFNFVSVLTDGLIMMLLPNLNCLMKVHHTVHIMKGSFLHQNFVSILTDGLIMMLLLKGSFILAENVWSSWFLERTAKTQANERYQGKPNVMNFYFQINFLFFYLSSFVFLKKRQKSSTIFFLVFQTSSSMVPFIVDSLENLVCSFVERFILRVVLKKAKTDELYWRKPKLH